jgi:hypothetical protein
VAGDGAVQRKTAPQEFAARRQRRLEAVTVAEEITSPELVLVSPPELAALAREALPDYELEFEEWTMRVRAALETEAAVQELVPEWEPRPGADPSTFTFGAFAFTLLSGAAAVAPLVLLIVFR